MKTLYVNITNLVATYSQRGGDIVCDNKSRYQIKFTFDADWSAYSTKTARFVHNGAYTDVDFTGDTVTVPMIHNADSLKVGVYAGDLCTTTPAEIKCVLSISSLSDTPSTENDRNWANEAKEAAERAAEDAREEVTRLVGEIGVVNTKGTSPTAAMSQKAATDNIEAILEAFDTTGGYNLLDPNNAESGYYANESGVLVKKSNTNNTRTVTPIPLNGSKVYLTKDVEVSDEDDTVIGITYLDKDGAVLAIYSTKLTKLPAQQTAPSKAVEIHIHKNGNNKGHSFSNICVSTVEASNYEEYGATRKVTKFKDDYMPDAYRESIENIDLSVAEAQNAANTAQDAANTAQNAANTAQNAANTAAARAEAAAEAAVEAQNAANTAAARAEAAVEAAVETAVEKATKDIAETAASEAVAAAASEIAHEAQTARDAADEATAVWGEFEKGVEGAVENWLDSHPEATTTVQDYSLTADKMVKGTLPYVTPEMYGAVGDGTADDTLAIQAAIDNANGGPVILSNVYKVTAEIVIDEAIEFVLYGEIRFYGTGICIKVVRNKTTHPQSALSNVRIVGNGLIRVKNSEFDGDLIAVRGGIRNLTLRIKLKGESYNSIKGKAVSLITETADTEGESVSAIAYTDIEVFTEGFKYGIYAEGIKSWINCNKFGSYVTYCTYGIYLKNSGFECGDNTIYHNGQSGLYNAECPDGCAVFIGEGCNYQHITIQSMDVGRTGFNKYAAILESNNNTVTHIFGEQLHLIQDRGTNNTIVGSEVYVSDIANVFKDLSSQYYTVEPIGNTVIHNNKAFQYKKQTERDSLYFGLSGEYGDGVKLTIDLSSCPLSLDAFKIKSSGSNSNARLTMTVESDGGIETAEIKDWANKAIKLKKYFTWKPLYKTKKIKVEILSEYKGNMYVRYIAFASDSEAVNPYYESALAE